jgi:hypothetical protein
MMATVVGAILAGSFTLVGPFVGHQWSERRERRNRRDELQLDLYVDAVSLIIDDAMMMLEMKEPNQVAPPEHQAKQHAIRHRLKLLGSPAAQEAYTEYHTWVFRETANASGGHSQQYLDARDKFLAKMRADIDASQKR